MAYVYNNIISKYCVILLIAGLVFQLTGYLSPGWFIIETYSSQQGIVITSTSCGVWYAVFCTEAEGCETKSMVGALPDEKQIWEDYAGKYTWLITRTINSLIKCYIF